MKNALQLAVISTLLFSQVSGARVIYGEDHRKEVSEATEFEQRLAKSAASMVAADEITTDPSRPGVVQLKQTTFRQWLESQTNKSTKMKGILSDEAVEAANEGITFCDGERFVEQPNPASCSGFLIGPDLLVTAGHCVDIPDFCSSFKWVFDFKVDPTTSRAGVDIDADNVYKCEKVVSNLLSQRLGLDYGLVKLDRQVKGREPLELRANTKVALNTELLVIGSPSGLPLKVTTGGKVRDNAHPFFLSSNLDTFQGNSGSAVFNAQTGVVEGILVRGEQDFILNLEKQCIEANKCPDEGCRGEEITRMSAIPEVALKKSMNTAAETGDLATLKEILKLQVWVDFYGKDGESSLIKAVKAEQVEAIKLLIEKGADLNLRDAKGVSVMDHAIRTNNRNVIRLLYTKGARKSLLSEKDLLVLSVGQEQG